MQDPSRHAYGLYHPLQPVEPLPSWSWNSSAIASNKGPMDVGGLMSGNVRHTANAEHLRRQMQHGLTMDTTFGMGQGGMNNHQFQFHMTHSAANGYPSHASAQAVRSLQSNISPVSSHSPTNMHSPKAKAEPAPKCYACSICQKDFARRSDLVRHGKQ